jgi:hypothetical protein
VGSSVKDVISGEVDQPPVASFDDLCDMSNSFGVDCEGVITVCFCAINVGICRSVDDYGTLWDRFFEHCPVGEVSFSPSQRANIVVFELSD